MGILRSCKVCVDGSSGEVAGQGAGKLGRVRVSEGGSTNGDVER